MNEHPYRFLEADPAPPAELHPLLQYLSDAFALLEDWILRPEETDPAVLRIGCRTHPAEPTEAGAIPRRATRRWHLTATAIDGHGQVQLLHPAERHGRPGWPGTYQRNAAGAEELEHDIVVRAVERTEARSQWNTWDTRPRRPEEIRIALRDAPGYHVQCPLDCDGKPMHVIATLEIALEDEDPDGSRTREVPVNRETAHLRGRLAACVRPLSP